MLSLLSYSLPITVLHVSVPHFCNGRSLCCGQMVLVLLLGYLEMYPAPGRKDYGLIDKSPSNPQLTVTSAP